VEKFPENKFFTYAEMVNYTEESILNCIIIENDAGTITLFAFGEGQSLSMHTAPYDTLVHALEGEGEFTVGEKVHKLKKTMDSLCLPIFPML